VIIAPTFADIFFNNCFKNGLLPIPLESAVVDRLFNMAQGDEALQVKVDLEKQLLIIGEEEIPFEVDAFRKHCLLEGLDDIGLTLQHVDEIRAYEEKRKQTAPWLFR
jgi:3-isopropylmalate/(R)-2-methylmalate dehydratase small subunit